MSRYSEANINCQRLHGNYPENEDSEIDDRPQLTAVSAFEVNIMTAFERDSFYESVYLNQISSNCSNSLFCRIFTPTLELPNGHHVDEAVENLLPTPSSTEKQQDNNFFARHLSGWRGGIASNAAMAMAVLVINCVILIWVNATHPVRNGLATVFSGDCTTAKIISATAHLFINILSTLLLAASNYAMQVASSPSRADIDRAHANQHSLDIGVLSLRNFRWISNARLLAYGLLLISSIVLHFM